MHNFQTSIAEPASPTLRARRAPLALKVAQGLRDDIASGRYAPGTCLPGEHHLALNFNVSRVTVREAIRRLNAEGRVYSEQGRGTFVAEVKAVQQLGTGIGFHASMRAKGVTVESRVLAIGEKLATRASATALGLKSASTITEIVRLRVVEERVVSLHIIQLPPEIGHRLVKEDLNSDLLPLVERAHGVPIGRIQLRVETGRCPAIISEHLGVPRGETLLILKRITHDIHQAPVEYEVMYCKQGACEFLIDIPRNTSF